ncbi:MAG: exosortase/archaeosortase family protein [Nitrososphaerales archaeon]|jgi:exosortase/archaeosortase family protein
MARMDRGHARLAAWLAATVLLVLTLYSNELAVLTSGLDELLTSTLGTVFPAYPFLALLIVLTALRWDDFHRVLLTERGPTSMPAVRSVGGALVVLPAALWALFSVPLGQSPYLAMEVAACSLVLVAYGALVALNPTMWRIMLPYASLYGVGLIAPLFLIDAFGAPMASLSSFLTARITDVLGVHVAWQGASFTFVSRSGETIDAVVTPACSAVYSIGIYLGLLGLMQLDVGRSLTTTAKFAIAGVLVIPLLDAARIALMIWFGFVDGSSVFWGVHDWLGYTIFFAFYIGVLAIYARVERPFPGRGAGAGPASGPGSLRA